MKKPGKTRVFSFRKFYLKKVEANFSIVQRYH
jgi:hypothetical protein